MWSPVEEFVNTKKQSSRYKANSQRMGLWITGEDVSMLEMKGLYLFLRVFCHYTHILAEWFQGKHSLKELKYIYEYPHQQKITFSWYRCPINEKKGKKTHCS